MLLDRYPQLGFLMQCAEVKPIVSSDELASGLNFDADAIYVYGLGDGTHLEPLLKWLEDDQKRDLIIVEDNLSALEAMSEHPMFVNPQVHVRVPFQSGVDERAFCDECARDWPAKTIQCVAMRGYEGKVFDEFALEMQRATVLTYARFKEHFYRDRLVKNVLWNIKRMEDSFFAHDLKGKYAGQCAIVCGAGPSLKDSIEALKNVKGKALIIAGGSAIASLSNQGIIPDFGLAVDPNEGEYTRLKASSAYEMPLLYGARVHPDVLNTTSAQTGYVQTISSDLIECDLMEALGLPFEPLGDGFGEEAMSVTTTAIAFAEMLGCDRIVLAGVDLSYTDGKRYAPGVFSDSSVDTSKALEVEKGVYTNIEWLMESKAIAKFAKQSQVQLYRASKKGLKIDGIGVQPIENMGLRSNVKPLYISEMKRMGDVSNALIAMRESAQRCSDTLGKLLAALDLKKPSVDHALLTVEEHDLVSEKAYRILLEPSIQALEYASRRECRGDDPEAVWMRKRALYCHLKRLSQSYLATFASIGFTKVNSTR